jgi:acetyltransferase-like isoleucine patch superfamily enzyme
MSVTYPHLENNKRNIFVGDDSQIPQLMLNIKGFASSKTSFGTDLFMWAPMTGLGQTENVKGLNLGVNLFGNFNTSFGTFNVRTGGINWHLLSPFTFQANKGYNRYSLFERNPWDPNTASMDSRYVDFFNSGAINQDQRWGNQAFQGLIIDGAQLPNDFAFSLMTGKTQFDGGVLALPNNSFGGKITKFYKQHQNSISANSFNNSTYLDSLAKNTTGFSVHTLEITHYIERLKIWAEIGIGNMIMHSSIINASATIGDNCIINTQALIEHDAEVGSNCHISTGAKINGAAKIGQGSFIGSGAIIRQGIKIGANSIIGAANS